MTQHGGAELLRRLERGETLISDGATGTYLQSRGLGDGDPEEWNASRPEVVREMAKAYFGAGSDLVLTNTFGGSRVRQRHYGFEKRVREFNKVAAEHARSEAPPGGFVVGSVGPTGEVLNDPLKDDPITEAEMYEAFAEQISALAEGGVDAVNIETMIDVEEAKIAIRAARENTNLVVFSTMFFDKGPRGFFTMMGTPPDAAMRELTAAGADVVGANCGNGVDTMLELAMQLRAATDAPLLVHSNAGIPVARGGEIIYPESPEYMAPRFRAMVEEASVNIVGGCCGTGPEHIRALVRALRA